MSIAVVANTAKASVNNTSVTSDAIDTTGADLLVLSVACYSLVSTVSDSKGNTWNARTLYGSGGLCQIFYAVNPTVGSGHTFTVSGGAATYPAVFVLALSGADLTAPYDVENGADTDSSTTIQTGSVTPSTDNQILITALSNYPAGTDSIDLSFTISDQLQYTANSIGGALAHLIQTTAAAKNPTWTHSVSATEIVGAIATFKAAAGGGAFTLTANSGSFALTGQAATLRAARTLAASSGSFALTGQPANLAAGRKLPAASGSFALTGQNVNFLIGKRLDAQASSFALTGQAAGLQAARRLPVAIGLYVLTGQDATLNYSGSITDATTPVFWARRPEVCRGARRPEVGRGARRQAP